MPTGWYQRKTVSSGILILGVSISALLVIAFPEWYHHGDVNTFVHWAELWNKGWREVYNTCFGCNYPILGIFSTAGVFKLLFRLGIPNTVQAFRLLLAAVDGLNVLLIFFLLKKLSVPNAAIWAGVTGLLASSWAGGAVWSQVDGVSQFFILLTLAWMVLYNTYRRIHLVVYLAVGSLLLACLLLTKQLIVFSFVSLEIFLTANIFTGRKFLSAVRYWLLHLIFLFGFVFIWDLFLNVEGPYFSHLLTVWITRSDTAGALSMNGFSLWVFLNRNMMRSSDISIFPLSDWSRFLTPLRIGIALFAILFLVIAVSTVRYVRRRHPEGEVFLRREDIYRLILLLAVVNLIFNVVMTGTHERYLFHFYPYLLIACLGLREFDKRFSTALLIFIFLGANLYGWFVLRVLWGDIAYDYSFHKYVAIYHLVLLTVLFFLGLTYPGFGKRLAGSGNGGAVPATTREGKEAW
jgi:hypothetical protein